MTTEKRTRRKYTEEFKRDAVALVTDQGYKVSEAARSLDVGAYWGYFCHRMEDHGFNCTAIEYLATNQYFLKRLRDIEKKQFDIFSGTVFDYREDKEFVVVLALNIFHHFLKTKEDYDRLVELLGRLKMKRMFFEPHCPDEAQMQGSYKNLGKSGKNKPHQRVDRGRR